LAKRSACPTTRLVESSKLPRVNGGNLAENRSLDPMPLLRKTSPATEFPVSALGDLAGDAVVAIHAATMAPMPMCATSILAAMSLATQAHADVELAHGNSSISPLSLFCLVVAQSGERKSTVDRLATKPVRDREEELRQAHMTAMGNYENALAAWDAARKGALKTVKGADALKAALDKLGAATFATKFCI
jgi:hypothetical protein